MATVVVMLRSNGCNLSFDPFRQFLKGGANVQQLKEYGVCTTTGSVGRTPSAKGDRTFGCGSASAVNISFFVRSAQRLLWYSVIRLRQTRGAWPLCSYRPSAYA